MTIEKLKSGSYRVAKMVKGVMYRRTIDHEPTKEEAEAIIRSEMEKKKWTKAKKKRQTFVYFIENPDNSRIKIGLSTDVNVRLRDLKTACGSDLQILGTIEERYLQDGFNREREMHRRFKNHRILINGQTTEWFDGCIKPDVLNLLMEVNT